MYSQNKENLKEKDHVKENNIETSKTDKEVQLKTELNNNNSIQDTNQNNKFMNEE